MISYCIFSYTEQLSHLRLCQPHGFIFQPHLQSYSLVRLVKYNLALLFHTLSFIQIQTFWL